MDKYEIFFLKKVFGDVTPGTFIFTLIRHINHVTIEKWRKK